MLGHNRKMTGAECLADMLKEYGVTHVFMVPAVLRRTFAEMERRTLDRAHPHPRREIRRLHGRRLCACIGQARHLHGAGDRRAQSRRRPARRLARAFAGHRHDRRPRRQDQVPQGLPGDRRHAGVRAGDQVQRHDRRRRALPRHGAAGVPRRHHGYARPGASAIPRQRGPGRRRGGRDGAAGRAALRACAAVPSLRPTKPASAPRWSASRRPSAR